MRMKKVKNVLTLYTRNPNLKSPLEVLLHPFSSLLSRHKRQLNFGSLVRTMFGVDSTQNLNQPQQFRTSRHLNDQSPNKRPNNVFNNGACTHKFDWKTYQRMDRIYSYLDCLAFHYVDRMQIITIGKSYENRPLKVVRIGNGANAQARNAIWIDGGIHAREWISPASVLFIIKRLVEDYDQFRDVLNNYEFYILPVVNPDGYEFTHTHNRMWRKTRSNPRGLRRNNRCVGADPNRNWSYEWGGKGASPNPCDETYRGERAFSESETMAVRNFIMSRAHRFKLFLTMHSYGQFILYPWGHERMAPNNWRQLELLGATAGEAMREVNDHRYTIGSAAQVLYPAAGGSDDWARGQAKIPYTYTIELPDTGRYGFLLPAPRIKSTVQEAFVGVLAMVRALNQFP